MYQMTEIEKRLESIIVDVFKTRNTKMTMAEVLSDIYKTPDNVSNYPEILIRKCLLRMVVRNDIVLGEYRIMSLALTH